MSKTNFLRMAKNIPLWMLLIVFISCERDITELEPASFSTNPMVFIDGFSGGLEYAAFGGSVPTAFQVDNQVTHTTTSTASMRFEVPNASDPRGAYAGGAFFTSVGRDLSGYDALTFWAKASKAATIDIVGFGNDLGESKYQASVSNLPVNTNWQKYVIPLPDPSKLTQEKGMFYYSEGPEEGLGYTFWIDELKFEKLGTIAQPQSAILSGANQVETSFIGVSKRLEGLQSIYNLPTGVNQAVNVSPAYFEFSSSDASIATVDETGRVTVTGGPGNAVITANLGGVQANGSLTIQSGGEYVPAPTPDKEPENVISFFSEAYQNVPVDYYNGFWAPFQTTGSADFIVNGDRVLNYTNFNFVGIEFTSPTVDATEMTHLHLDIFLPNTLSGNAQFNVELNDLVNETGGSMSTTIRPDQAQQWISLDLPLSGFVGLNPRNHLTQIVFVDGSGNIPGFYADNIYLYKEIIPPFVLDVPAPEPTRDAADVVSMFSDAYTNVPVDTWRTDWSAAVLEDIEIQGNATKKYSALDFVGIETVSNQVDLSEMTHMHIDFFSQEVSQLGIKLVDFGPNGIFGGGDDAEHQVNITAPNQNEWVSLDIPLSQFAALIAKSNIAQLILVAQPTGATTLYVDNIYFYKDEQGGGGGQNAEPAVAAPTPTRDPAAVISMFSDAYTNVPVDTWRTSWSSAVLQDVQIAGNATKKYVALDFVGVETVSNQIDISGMTHMHLNVWSEDFTFFAVKLVDFGADGAFGGGDDTEHQVNVEMPTQREWVSLDIPMGQFAGLTSRSNLAQMILVGQPTGATTVFVDNVYFYDADYQAGELNAPATAAPTPTQEEDAVISLFSDAYTNATVDTWRTDWSSAVLEDIQVQGNATKKYSALDFVGVETVNNQIDISGMTHMRMDVWSADYTFFAVKLVDFGADGAFGGGDDTEHQVNVEMPAQREWVSLDIPMGQFAGLTSRSNLAQMILVGQPTGATTVFVDNVYFYDADYQAGELNAPATAAPTPTQEPASVLSLFSDAYTNVNVDTWRTDWSSAVLEDIQIQGNATKKYSALDFVGIETVGNQVDISGLTHMRMDVWSSDFTFFGVKLVDFGPDGGFGGGDDTEHQINIESPAQRGWVSLDIPLSEFSGLTTRKNIAQIILVGQPTGATTVFVDNVYFYDANFQGGGGGTDELSAPAPTPTLNAEDVISVFSDAYTNVPVDTWRTGWSSATLEDITIQGNATKKYSTLDFVGIETVSSQINASEMTHIRMDVYSKDFTFFGIKLVDFGANGAFGGGDDTEHQVNIEAPAQNQWVTIDLPLSRFSGMTSRSNIAQMILVGQPTGATTVYVDNILFYKAEDTGGGGGGGGGDTGTAIFSQTFDNAASVSNWERIADANSSDANIQWIAGGGVEGGALQLTAANPSDAAGKAYIFQVPNTGLNFGGKTKVRLTFDIKLGAPLVAAAVHLQTIFPGLGVTNNFDLQGQGLNQNNWTTLSFEFDGVDAAADNFIMHFNLASGAVTNAGGVLLIDNIRLSGLD